MNKKNILFCVYSVIELNFEKSNWEQINTFSNLLEASFCSQLQLIIKESSVINWSNRFNVKTFTDYTLAIPTLK